MKQTTVRLALAMLLLLSLTVGADAHCIVGNRFFPATLTVDDPCVADELSMPTIAGFKNGDEPSADEVDIGGEYSKTITPNFGVSFEETWIHLDTPGEGTASGFDNLGTSFKYQIAKAPSAEFALSVSLDVDWGGTGAKAVDAESFTTLTPTAFAGQGFGFLPESMKLLRPFAVTAQVGYAVPTRSSSNGINEDSGLFETTPNPQVLVWGGTLQYSMPYLKSSVRDFGLPEVINHLIPIVELNLASEVSNFDDEERTTGTVNPGLIYVGNKYQLAAEAIIPINRASGDGVGVIGQLHFYLDDIFPNSLGRPIFPAAIADRRMIMSKSRTILLALASIGWSAAADAHAMLDHASPAVGSTVASSPGAVTLYFTEALESKFSAAEVHSAGGGRVDHGASVSGSTMRISVGSLAPGSYSVTWHVTSVDTHKTQGSFSFRVGK